MKKLIVMAAVLCAALGLRAAQATWNSSISEFSADWVTDPVGSVVIAIGGNEFSGDFESGAASVACGLVDSDTAFDVTMNLVLDDGKTYTKTLSFTTPTFAGTPADQQALMALDADISAAFATPDGNLPDAATAAAQGWAKTGSVPEPTSGLLLLLGVAGLALLRKCV